MADAPSGDASGFFDIAGCNVEPSVLSSDLAKSFVRFVQRTDGVVLEKVVSLGHGCESVVISAQTGAAQFPAFDILPVERLALLFLPERAPLVVPLRHGFPAAPHTFGLPVAAPLDGDLALCLDDRQWEDAQSDYNGAEIMRRIWSWFERASSGRMNDEQQFVDPAFLPSPTTVVITKAAWSDLERDTHQPIFLALTNQDEESPILLAERFQHATASAGVGREWLPFLAIPIFLKVDNDRAMWRPPTRLGHLRVALRSVGLDFLEMLRCHLGGLLREATSESVKTLYDSRLLVLAVISNIRADRVEWFGLLSRSSTADIGVALGLINSPERGLDIGYTRRLTSAEPDQAALDRISVEAVNLSQAFDQQFATSLSNRPELMGLAIIVGVGAIGSQAANLLVREGAFTALTIVDDDRLLPHNLARHILSARDIGSYKAEAVGRELMDVRPDLSIKVVRKKLDRNATDFIDSNCLSLSKYVLDFTASVGAGRAIADLRERGRGVSAFFNPAGTAFILLVEDSAKKLDLAILEADYYGMVIERADLNGHLIHGDMQVVSSGQCRSLSSRIPSADAALLSAAAARSISQSLVSEDARLVVGTIDEGGSLRVINEAITGVNDAANLDGWQVRLPPRAKAQIEQLRKSLGPNETGGVLLGIVDYRRKRIEIVSGMRRPPDSVSELQGFERGIQGLQQQIDQACAKVMHQVCYVGEWHSHPDGFGARKSAVDSQQIKEVAAQLAVEERPAVMVIAGEHETRIHLEAKI